jgi:phosphatidylinositol-3-phosphatase
MMMVAGCGGGSLNTTTTTGTTGATTGTTGATTGNTGTTGATTGTTGSGGNDDMGPSASPDMATPTKPAGSCGTCPSGSTCGSANGIAVCRTASGIPVFTNIFVITMENTSMSSLQKSTTTPYLHSLMMNAAYASDYHGVTHPSLPNYLAMTSGSPGVQSDGTTAVSCDCDPVGSTCNNCSTISTLFSSCGCEQQAQHLGDQLDPVGKKWRNYGDGMGAACNKTTSGSYATRHLPFLYYKNVQEDSARCSDHVVDYGSFAADLSAGSYALSFIAPSLSHDMHGTGLTQGSSDVTAGDTWLSTNVGNIVASNAYKNGGLVIIVWDEDDLSGTLAKDDPIPLFVLSPFAKSGGYPSPVHADHYALLATIEDSLGVGRLGNAASASPLTDFFPTK